MGSAVTPRGDDQKSTKTMKICHKKHTKPYTSARFLPFSARFNVSKFNSFGRVGFCPPPVGGQKQRSQNPSFFRELILERVDGAPLRAGAVHRGRVARQVPLSHAYWELRALPRCGVNDTNISKITKIMVKVIIVTGFCMFQVDFHWVAAIYLVKGGSWSSIVLCSSFPKQGLKGKCR